MRTALGLQFTIVVTVALLGVAVPAATGVAVADQDGVWVNGVVHTLIVTGPGTGKPRRPLYVIAPVSPAHPLHPLPDAKSHGFGAHDHVIALADPKAIFHGTCDLTLVVPSRKAKLGRDVRGRMTLTPAGAKPLLYAARIGGRFEPLDRAGRIRRAIRAGLASAIDTHLLLACTIKPLAP
jgi:hypothetical protein